MHAEDRCVICFLLFSYVIFPFLETLCCVFSLYGIHVCIHIFVRTMEACNKGYGYILLLPIAWLLISAKHCVIPMETVRRLTASMKIKVYGGNSINDCFEIAVSTSRILQTRLMWIRDGNSNCFTTMITRGTYKGYEYVTHQLHVW